MHSKECKMHQLILLSTQIIKNKMILVHMYSYTLKSFNNFIEISFTQKNMYS